MSIRLLSSILLLTASLAISAADQEDPPEVMRPVTSAYALEIGGARITDTYLSPLKYSGTDIAFSYERMQAMKFNPEQWVMRLTAGVGLEKTENPSGNATIWGSDLNVSWGMMRRWNMSALLPRLTVAVGGSVNLSGGALYNTRNGNNPISAKASALISLTGYATYGVTVAGVPVTFRYQPTLPITGAFFSPDYGELYYEIYLGNHSGLAHAAWWGNYFRLDNLVTADIRFGATALRLGYSGSILSTKVNDIVNHRFTHCAVIGISGEWLTLNPRHALSPDARIISALY